MDVGRVLVPNDVFERPDLDDESLLTLVRSIQQKLAFIEKVVLGSCIFSFDIFNF